MIFDLCRDSCGIHSLKLFSTNSLIKKKKSFICVSINNTGLERKFIPTAVSSLHFNR